MKLNAYVIYDNSAKVYNKPFYFVNHQVALRALGDLLNDPNTDISRHPTDFTLWFLGEYSDTSAQFSLLEHPELVARAHELETSPFLSTEGDTSQ